MNIFKYFKKKPSTPIINQEKKMEYNGIRKTFYSIRKLFSEDKYNKRCLTQKDFDLVNKCEKVSQALTSISNRILKSEFSLYLNENIVNNDPRYEFIYNWLQDNHQIFIGWAIQACLYGQATIELVYPQNNLEGQFLPNLINLRSYKEVKRDIYTGDLYWVDNLGREIKLNPLNYIMLTNYENVLDREGDALMPILSKLVNIRDVALSDWACFVSLASQPTKILNFGNSGVSQELKDKYEESLKEIEGGLVLILENKDATYNEIYKTQTHSTQYEIINYIDNCIVTLILGQNLTSEVKGVGSYGAVEGHKEILDDRIFAYKKFISFGLRQVIQGICYLNNLQFQDIKFKYEESNDVYLDRANRDKVLHDIGIKFTPEYIESEYGIDNKYFTIANSDSLGLDGIKEEA